MFNNMTSKQDLMRLGIHSSLKEPKVTISNCIIGTSNSKFEFKRTQQEKNEDKVPDWEFDECHGELITFTEKERRRYTLTDKYPDCIVSVDE